MSEHPTIGVVGATGAVGTVTLELLRARGYENVRVFASARSALEHQWDRGDNVTTEDLRIALQRYRSFFDRLLRV